MELQFVDELPKKNRTGTVKLEVESAVEALVQRPGDWAIIFSGLNTSTAAMRSRMLKQYEGIESVSRGGDVYARAIEL